MSTQDPAPTTADVEPEATDEPVDPDVQSDPALADGDDAPEWSGEGGAAQEGPATDA